MAKSSHPTVKVGIYRSDQQAEHNSPTAWKAHKLRAQVFDKAAKHKSFRAVTVSADFYDEENTHEFADAVVEILKEPATQVVLTTAGMYIKPLDDWVAAGVKRLYKSLASAFQKKQISEFFIQLPSGEQITVGPDSHATITVAGGKVTKVELGGEKKVKSTKPKPRRR